MNFVGKIRPQILLALSILGVIAFISVRMGNMEVAIGCITGVVALAKDVLQSDS